MIRRFEFRAMGCQMLAALDSSAANASSKLEQTAAWFEAWEQSLSRFRPDSELNQLNDSTGQSLPVSQTLWEVFQYARRAHELSHGLVNPTILDALVAAGYDRSFDQLQPEATRPSYQPQAANTAMESIVADPVEHRLQLPDGVHLDFGGVAKGWAAYKAMRRLRAYGPALVDAGGDIAISGNLADGQPWPIAVEDPQHPGNDMEQLMLGGCGVATSGVDHRRWLQAGVWRHHIIDPRTGLPADSDLLSVTVIAPDVMTAETAAKTVLILGSQAGLAWLEAQPGLAGLLTLMNGGHRYSQRMPQYIWS